MKRLFLCFIWFLVGSFTLYAHGPATHLYLASQMFDAWQDYDSDFYNTLLRDDSIGMMTRKFYYIGVLLPDLLDSNGQHVVQALITSSVSYTHLTLPTKRIV